MSWTILVCPNCELHQLPPGTYRARCPGCDTYFSREDERPDETTKYPQWWERNKHRYPTPGKRVKVERV